MMWGQLEPTRPPQPQTVEDAHARAVAALRMSGQAATPEPLAEGGLWDQGQFAPVEEHLEAMWKGEAEGMLTKPGDPSPEARAYVLGYVRGCRMREWLRRESQR